MSKNIVAILLIILAFGVWQFLFKPQTDRVMEARSDYQAVKGVLEELDRLEVKRDELQTAYNQVKSAPLAKLERVIPKNTEVSGLIIDLEAIAARRQLTLASLDFQSGSAAGSAKTAKPASQSLPGAKPSEASPVAAKSSVAALNLGGGLETVTVGMSVSGQYASLVNFLKDIELYERITDVSSINFGAPPEGSNYQVKIQAKIYRR